MNKTNYIELSLAPKNLNPKENSHFETREIDFTNLENICSEKNFSTIIWKNGVRKGTNYLKANGIVIDIDSGITIEDALNRLKKNGLSYFLIPSKSHSEERHKFHIIIPFKYPVYVVKTYKKIISDVSKKLFPECDEAVFDAGRFIFGSPDHVKSYIEMGDKFLHTIASGDIWDATLIIKTADNKDLLVGDFDKKTTIYCPFHKDNSPSAFIDYSEKSENYFIHCSSCGESFWMDKEPPSFDEICNPYWSHGKDIFEIGLNQDEFYMQKINEKKFHVMTGSFGNKSFEDKLFEYLVSNKHISHLSRIDYIGDVFSDEHNFSVDLNKGVILVSYSPIPVKRKDNSFIEDYLEERFGLYKTFIKEWLAVYCYDNYKKLPTLILKGGRGTGKSTFAEMVGEIYKPLSSEWHGHEQNFTYESEKKLLIVEENEQNTMHQYKTLKKYTGQKYARVHKKFKDPYKVKNNMNIILLSNDGIPLYVSREEAPSNEANNQFFVYEFQEIPGELTANIQDALLDRLGNYIRTELKTVYESLSINRYRYSIRVPITDEESALFQDNVTDLESVADGFVQKLILKYTSGNIEEYAPFINAGYIPTPFFKNYSIENVHYNRVVKNLKKRGYLKGSQLRKQIGSDRQYCHKMTLKLLDEIKNATFESI